MLFLLQNDGSPSVTFQLRVRELKDMKILNSLRRLGDIIFSGTRKPEESFSLFTTIPRLRLRLVLLLSM